MIYLKNNIVNGPVVDTYELETIQDAEEVIIRLFRENENLCMAEVLSLIEISGLSIQAQAELYIGMRNSVGECLSIVDECGEFAL